MIALALLLACQEPFGSDRHRLEDFRIAGVSVSIEGSVARPEALVVVHGALWSDAPVDLAWVWLEPDEDPDGWTGIADGAGPEPELALPGDPARLLLVAVAPDGTERRAILDLDPAVAPEPVGALTFEVLPWELGRIEASDLELEARAKVEGTPGRRIEPAGFARISEEPPGSSLLRWMSPTGTFFELEPTRADWTPGTLVLDDEQIESTRPGEPGAVPIVALRPTEGAAARWQIADLISGGAADGAFVEGRWLPGAIGGWQRATLIADPASSTGLAAVDPIPLDPTGLPEPSGPCATWERFVPGALATGVCIRPDLEGRTLAFEGVVDP